jgi:hypothetical protein
VIDYKPIEPAKTNWYTILTVVGLAISLASGWTLWKSYQLRKELTETVRREYSMEFDYYSGPIDLSKCESNNIIVFDAITGKLNCEEIK